MITKPVAWMSPDGKVSQTEGKLFHIPLYTKPQQWHMVNKDGYVKPLTKEEIDDLAHEHNLLDDYPYDFARAIEERHGIK
jgi:hypothetical protein